MDVKLICQLSKRADDSLQISFRIDSARMYNEFSSWEIESTTDGFRRREFVRRIARVKNGGDTLSGQTARDDGGANSIVGRQDMIREAAAQLFKAGGDPHKD